MNKVSSRSHMILTLYVKKYHKKDDSYTNAKLNIVDLAGSEKLS